MKVQITVDEEVWRKAKAHAAMNDMTLGEVVCEGIGLVITPVEMKVGKVVLAPVTPTTPISAPKKAPVVETMKELKEGFGWCRGCGKKMVELPAFLCKECRVEAGEDL